MGEIRTPVTLENSVDRGLVGRGQGTEAGVRRTTVGGIVDTGAVQLILPEELVNQLGIEQVGTRTIVYADERPLAGPVTVQIGELATRTDCIVGVAGGGEILIGQLVLEALDLIADCTNRRVTPRHPDGPVLAAR